MIPGGYIRLEFADARGLSAAASILGEVSRDDNALTLELPTDGGVRSLRALLERVDDKNIEVANLIVHTPDLDDVFFALTGHPVTEKEPAP
jgi:ABC-2 type transport system ATP-binding protein